MRAIQISEPGEPDVLVLGDVGTPRPGDVEVLVDALADFGATRRLSMLEAGEPVTRPSERTASGRRKARAK